MANSREVVNLDAMILRSDFAYQNDTEQEAFESIENISVRDFMSGSLVGPNLRKPDFQRETNHWTPEQVCSFLECFVNGELIPSVILWKSPTNIFVVDGGHRLSVLKAWVEDDYGDGPRSLEFFNRNISRSQSKAAKKTSKLIEERIGKFNHVRAKLEQSELPIEERKKLNRVISRALPIQWVPGDAEKAEASFFKINTEGTPLDDIEEQLLKTRKKPISIAARAIIRAGTGHKYWSSFALEISLEIEEKAKKIHELLFEPEIESPIKTLDLPLGGSKGVRVALKTLLEFCLIACGDHQGRPLRLSDLDDDIDGSGTIRALNSIFELARRITGNEHGSLGLHPAVYFYGPTGQHQAPMFMGTALIIKQKLLNNDPNFFKTFTACRQTLEKVLVDKKSIIATILQKCVSKNRVETFSQLIDGLVSHINNGDEITNELIITLSGLAGKFFDGVEISDRVDFSTNVKSEAFIRKALLSAVRCPICNGYIDPSKSISYDHKTRKRDGGDGSVDNCDLTHPYCNQSIKN